jgi:uncharacterized membrane protein YhiD involved in acid resistance
MIKKILDVVLVALGSLILMLLLSIILKNYVSETVSVIIIITVIVLFIYLKDKHSIKKHIIETKRRIEIEQENEREKELRKLQEERIVKRIEDVRIKKEEQARKKKEERLKEENKLRIERENKIYIENLNRKAREMTRQKLLEINKDKIRDKRRALQERGTEYSAAIIKLMKTTPCYWKMYEHNVSICHHLSANHILNTNNGTDIIEHSEALVNYIAAYAGMHYHKLIKCFQPVFEEIDNGSRVDIIDYGCGQALATLALYDYIIKKNKKIQIDKIILNEPSDIALKRGILKLNKFIDHKEQITELVKVNKQLDNLTVSDIESNHNNVKIHLLSNIIDVNGFCLSRFSQTIKSSQRGKNYFICVSPTNMGSKQRIDTFMSNFSHHKLAVYEGLVYGKVWSVINKKWLDNYKITMVQRVFRCDFEN